MRITVIYGVIEGEYCGSKRSEKLLHHEFNDRNYTAYCSQELNDISCIDGFDNVYFIIFGKKSAL
jgi:hypothetical protein